MIAGRALGRPKKDNLEEKKEAYHAECERVEVERKFSPGKRKFSMSQLHTYLQETTRTVLALSILAMV